MAVQAGRQRFGPDQGKIVLLTTRDGLAAQAGHDLTIEVGTWSAELEVGDDLGAEGIMAQADMNSLVIRNFGITSYRAFLADGQGGPP